MALPTPLPDDPRKWDGWNKFTSDNYYERLCIDPDSNPSDQIIEENCRQILVWWQKKLPLKNQPSNPLAQLLRAGLDTAPKYITEARSELLNPASRKKIDAALREKQQIRAREEFNKFLSFALSDKILTVEEENSLIKLGREQGLSLDEIETIITLEVVNCEAVRYSVTPPPPPVVTPLIPQAAPPPYVTPNIPFSSSVPESQEPRDAFMQMLRMARLTLDQLEDRRETFIDMAENLGLDEDEAEEILEDYATELESAPEPTQSAKVTNRVAYSPTGARPGQPGKVTANIPHQKPATPKVVLTTAEERNTYQNFVNSFGGQMLFIPSAKFVMGSTEADAAPNEHPLTTVKLLRYYISRHPITNKQYELFDPSHRTKRATWADENHPVVYVSSLDAMKFCSWLSAREKKKYRLPTEAEWEYAAKGNDGRRYPWGNEGGRGDMANFADARTNFAWSDHSIDDGFAETSPVGSFPLGASPFGLEDMAGNVFEWCSDYFEDYKGGEKTAPRGAAAGSRRVYRGGSWRSRFSSLRCTARNSNIPAYASNDVGFRIVCEADE